MPSVEVCKERGIWEYSCGSDGPCPQSPTGNCKGRCEDEVPRCKNECDDPCTGERCNTCKASCESNGGYMPRHCARRERTSPPVAMYHRQ